MAALHDFANGEDSVSCNRETMTKANSLLAAIEKLSFVQYLMAVFQIQGSNRVGAAKVLGYCSRNSIGSRCTKTADGREKGDR